MKAEEKVKYEEQIDQFTRQIEVCFKEVSLLEHKNRELTKQLKRSETEHSQGLDGKIEKVKKAKNEEISRLSKELEAIKQREIDLGKLRDKSRVDLEKEFVGVKLENKVLMIKAL